MGITLKGVWNPADISNRKWLRFERYTMTKKALIRLGEVFSGAVKQAIATGRNVPVELGINGVPNAGKSTFVSGVLGRKKVNPDLTIDTIDVEGMGTVIHADLGNPSLYKNPIDLMELRRKNHAERHGIEGLCGVDIVEHAGNCQWGREFDAAIFLGKPVLGSSMRRVVFVASEEFAENKGF